MKTSLAILTLAAALGMTSVAAAAPNRAPQVQHQAQSAPAASAGQESRATAPSYAQREAAASRDLEEFAGGKDDVIYIGIGTVLLIVLILLLI